MKRLISIKTIGFTLSLFLFLGAEVTLIKLAIWQYNRMNEKEMIVQKVEEQMAVAPKDLLANPNPPEWRWAYAIGQLDYDREVLLDNQRLGNYVGYRILTPLVMNDNREVVVDRGWIPRGPELPDLTQYRDERENPEFTGLVRAYHEMKKGAMKGALYGTNEHVVMLPLSDVIPQQEGLLRMPYYLQANKSGNAEIKTEVDLPAGGARHLNYMLTWALCALVLPIMYTIAVRGRLKRASQR